MKRPRWTVYDREDQDGRSLRNFRHFRKALRYTEELRAQGINAVLMPLEGWK